MMVALWRCECGVRLRVLAENDRELKNAAVIVLCPICGARKALRDATEVLAVDHSADSLLFDNG